MPDVICECGARGPAVDLSGNTIACEKCHRPMHYVGSGIGLDPQHAESLLARLLIESGPERVGEQIYLSGDSPIEIGKLPDQPICLAAPLVSRRHCQLSRGAAGEWIITDRGSTNGLFVNGDRVTSAPLREGDLIDIGNFTLRFTAPNAMTASAAPRANSSKAPTAALAATGAPRAAAPRVPASNATAPAAPQPSSAIADDDVLHLAPDPEAPDVLEEVPLLSSESDFLEVAHTDIPLAPAARPAPRRIATPAPWVGSVRTCPHCKKQYGPLEKICVACGVDLKTGKLLVTSQALDLDSLYANTNTIGMFLSWIMPIGLFPIASDAFGKHKPYAMWTIIALTIVISVFAWIADASADSQGDLFGPSAPYMLWTGDTSRGIEVPNYGTIDVPYEFHWYQLVTNAFLHGGIEHLLGNMVFLMVFGNRINALVGQWKAAALYLLLAILASLTFYFSRVGQFAQPALGASGAIMGMAGMYLVLMPRSRVFMVFWLRLGLFTGFRRIQKIFSVSAIWLLIIFFVKDVLEQTLMHDNVAHWAHMGGFIFGALIALILLLTKQVDANGGDILTWIFGPSIWKYIGTPEGRTMPMAA